MNSRWLQELRLFQKGKLKIEWQGNDSERFLNLCEHNKIELYHVKKNGMSYTAEIHPKNYRALLLVFRKTRIRPKIVQKKGLPFFLLRHRYQKLLLFCMLLFASFVYYLSGFVWRIEYSGGYLHTPEQLSAYMKKIGIYEGVRKSNISCARLEEQIRKKYPDIGWASAELKGTCIHIKIKEIIKPELITEQITDGLGNRWEEPYGHMIADRDGIVTNITVLSGSPKVRVGDVVKKGDILISGILEIFGDDERIINKIPTLAKGEVGIIYSENYHFSEPSEIIQKEYDKTNFSGFTLLYGNHKIFSYSYGNSDVNCDIITKMEQYCLGTSFYLPFKVLKQSKAAYHYVTEEISKERAEEIANERLADYIAEQEKNGGKLISMKQETRFLTNVYQTKAQFVFDAPAWRYLTINPKEWRITDTDEYNTDGN